MWCIFIYQWQPLCRKPIGERRKETGKSLGSETSSLICGLLRTWALKENWACSQTSFHYPRGMTHAELAGPPLSRRHILPLWMPSGKAQLEAAGFLHRLSYSANQGRESAREAFSLHFSPPVICHDPRDRVYSICQNDWDNLSGELLLRLLSNLSWQQSGLVSEKGNQRKRCLAYHFWWCWGCWKSNHTQLIAWETHLNPRKVDQVFHLDSSAFRNPAVYHTIEIVYLAIFFTRKRQKKIVFSLPILPTLHFILHTVAFHCTQGFTS